MTLNRILVFKIADLADILQEGFPVFQDADSILVIKWDPEGSAPVVPGSDRDHSQRDRRWRNILLQKNSVYHFVQSPVTTYNDNVPVAFFYKFVCQLVGMVAMFGQDTKVGKAC